MSAVVAVRHPVEDFEKWKLVFDEHRALHESHGARRHRLLVDQNVLGTQLILNEFPNREAVEAFISDPSLPEAMARAGAADRRGIEFYEVAERLDYGLRRADTMKG
jgi:hypothetical protein